MKVMVVAVLLVIPVLKLSWTLGSGDAARDAMQAMGPANWPDIIIDIVLLTPLVATALGILVCRATFGMYADRRHDELPASGDARSDVALGLKAAIVPISVGIVVGSFNGLLWGLVAGVLGYLAQLGIIADFHSGRGRFATTADGT